MFYSTGEAFNWAFYLVYCVFHFQDHFSLSFENITISLFNSISYILLISLFYLALWVFPLEHCTFISSLYYLGTVIIILLNSLSGFHPSSSHWGCYYRISNFWRRYISLVFHNFYCFMVTYIPEVSLLAESFIWNSSHLSVFSGNICIVQGISCSRAEVSFSSMRLVFRAINYIFALLWKSATVWISSHYSRVNTSLVCLCSVALHIRSLPWTGSSSIPSVCP